MPSSGQRIVAGRMKKVKVLQAKVDRLLELLKRMPEWVYDKDQECYFCEICGNNKDYGHSKSCELAKELSDE